MMDMRRHLVVHWRAWSLVALIVILVNELVDRNSFDHRQHLDGDFLLAVVTVVIAFLASYFVARRKSRGVD
jgi:MFS superfamily sulfate permease-like transporter